MVRATPEGANGADATAAGHAHAALDRIYTKTGDDGTTGLGGGRRVPKDSPRVAAYGTVDELNSAIGVALALGLTERLDRPSWDASRTSCSTWVPTCAGRRTTSGATASRPSSPATSSSSSASIDELNDVGRAADQLPAARRHARAPRSSHVARTICRRAEREAITPRPRGAIGELVLPYLNRLSDALFVMARYENHARGVAEPLWQPGL